MIMNLVDVAKMRVENHEMMLPVKLRGAESDNRRAISFYSTSVQLAAAAKEISAQGRITALATNVNLDHICELNNRTILRRISNSCLIQANGRCCCSTTKLG